MSPKKIIIGVIAAIVLVQVLVFLRILPGRKEAPPASATISFWGTDDDLEVWRGIIESFQKQFPYLTVTYTQVSSQNYENNLVNAIAKGNGPDVFIIPNTFLIKERDKIYPFPQTALSFSTQDFSSTFVDAPQDLIASDGLIYGLPLSMDTPALFYNKDIMNTIGVAQVPTNWDDLVLLSQKITKKNAVGEITQSGLPLGTYNTVDNAFEILSSIMLQEAGSETSGLQIVSKGGAGSALSFYTSFANPDHKNFSWSDRLPDSLSAFAQTKSAFVIGLYGDIDRIRAKNPHLNFGIMPFPQKKGLATPVVYGRYLFATVLKSSKNPMGSWQFASYITGLQGASLYLKKTNKPPVRRDILNLKAPTQDLSTFYRQALIAKTWPIPDDIAARKLFQEAIESVVSGSTDASKAIDNLGTRLQLLGK